MTLLTKGLFIFLYALSVCMCVHIRGHEEVSGPLEMALQLAASCRVGAEVWRGVVECTPLLLPLLWSPPAHPVWGAEK